MMTAAKRSGFSIDPMVLWVFLFVVASDGLTVAGIVALATGGGVALQLLPLFGLLCVASVAALWRLVGREG